MVIKIMSDILPYSWVIKKEKTTRPVLNDNQYGR